MARSQGRTSIKGKHALPKKHVGSQYKYDFKHAVVQHYQSFSIDEVLRRFFANGLGRDTARKLVNKWTKNASTIAAVAKSQRTAVQQRCRQSGLATVLSVAAEEEIVRWINELRRDGVPASAAMLKLKGLEVAEMSGVPPRLFAASNPWKASFLRRHRLAFRTKNRSGQASPDADNAQGRAFAENVRAWMAQHGVAEVYNADQTAVFFEMLPKKTVPERSTQTVWVKRGKHEKQRATAMLRTDSDGNKYEPFLVFKAKRSTVDETHKTNVSARHGFGRQTWREIKALEGACGARIYGNETAWWTSDITTEWMRYFFGDRTSASKPVLLLLDSFSAHWTTDVITYAASHNVILKSVPPRLTWRCQPADVAWMKPLKDGLRRRWVSFLREQLQRHRLDGAPFVIVPPDRGGVAEWVTQEWFDLSARTVVSDFSKCGFCSRYDDRAPHVEHGAIVDVSDVADALAARGHLDASVGEVAGDADVVDALTEAIV